MPDPRPPITVYIIDDDDSVRRALSRVFKAAGFRSMEFSSTTEFMASKFDTRKACVLADMHIVGEKPAELPRLLNEQHVQLPVIFMSADNSEENLARVDSAGGVAFFRKPVDDQALIDSVKWAILQQGASA